MFRDATLNTPTEKTKIVEVSAAVLQRPDGSFLLTLALEEQLAIRLSPQADKSLVISPGERGQLSVSPILPANAPILRALAHAISNAAELGVEPFIASLQAKLDAGLRLVQLREKNLSRDALRELALRVVSMAHARCAKVLLNGDVALATLS